MDDIQFWIYIIFGIIYFLVRAFRKKNQQTPPSSSAGRPASGQTQQRKPVSFEDLLKEFTQEASDRTSQKEPEVEQPSHYKFDMKTGERIRSPKEKKKSEPQPEEGRNRTFSDDESKRIFEESIKRAEGATLKFETDSHYASKKMKTDLQSMDSGPSIAQELLETLSTSDGAKKAIILSEILNRKY